MTMFYGYDMLWGSNLQQASAWLPCKGTQGPNHRWFGLWMKQICFGWLLEPEPNGPELELSDISE